MEEVRRLGSMEEETYKCILEAVKAEKQDRLQPVCVVLSPMCDHRVRVIFMSLVSHLLDFWSTPRSLCQLVTGPSSLLQGSHWLR